MKNLKDADISDGIKAYNLSRLINGGFNVPDGFILNESDIEEIFSENTTDPMKYFSECKPASYYAVRLSLRNEEDKNNSFDETFESKLFLKRKPEKLIQAMKYVISSAKENHPDIFNYNNSVSLNIIIQNMIKESSLIGIAFSNAVDDNGNEIIRIEASEALADKLVPGSSSLSMVNVLKSDLNNNDEIIDVYGKSFDYSKMAELAKEVYNIEKYFKKPVRIEWCISDKGEIFFVQADTMKETYICT